MKPGPCRIEETSGRGPFPNPSRPRLETPAAGSGSLPSKSGRELFSFALRSGGIMQNAIGCPSCGCKHNSTTNVYRVAVYVGGRKRTKLRRRRCCRNCGRSFYTCEEAEDSEPGQAPAPQRTSTPPAPGRLPTPLRPLPPDLQTITGRQDTDTGGSQPGGQRAVVNPFL